MLAPSAFPNLQQLLRLSLSEPILWLAGGTQDNIQIAWVSVSLQDMRPGDLLLLAAGQFTSDALTAAKEGGAAAVLIIGPEAPLADLPPEPHRLSFSGQGGTNINDAIAEALHPRPETPLLPIVLFLTDGIPTVGRTREAEIRRLATDGNRFRRRIFTLGVGCKILAPLLGALALQSRGAAACVADGEPLAPKIAQLFRRLNGPVLSDVDMDVDPQGREPGVHDLIPATMPDLFEGDQIVLLGQYRGHEPLHVTLSGNRGAERRSFRYEFDLSGSTTANAYV